MKNNQFPEISIILPCRDEEKALGFCLQQIKNVVEQNKLFAEIIVSDSSFDSSPEIIRKAQIKQKNIILLKHDKEGYGVAYLEAFKIAKGKYIFMADADGTYDFTKIPEFIKELKRGSDLVIGDRLSGKIEKGAMPFMNRCMGTPILSFVLKLFFKAKIKDSQSGMRAMKKKTLEKLGLQTTGMEFASEMIMKALKNNLKIKEIPVDYYKRIGQSKLKPFSDGWKHLRFMLLYSPLFLFFVPGIIIFLLGLLSMLWIYLWSPQIFGIKLFYHPMFFSSALIIIGYQLIIFSAFAKIYSLNHLNEHDTTLEKLFKYITIERASIVGLLISFFGALIYFFIFERWISTNFGSLNEIKNSIIALTLVVLGVQTIFSSFMLSILGIKEK